MKKLAIIALLVVAGAAGAVWYQGGFGEKLPTPVPHQNFPSPTPTPTVTPPPVTSLPSEINLDVPFSSQAPKYIWDEDHDDFCEEASVLMAAAYANDFDIPNADFADAEMYKIKEFEIREFGYWKSNYTAEIARVLKEHSGIANVQLVENPTLNQIKEALASGKIIVAPFAGRQLGNPNFTGEGPLYHMLVIKGYTKDGKIITNDPGTRKGANYIYSSQTILNALHDWNGGDVNNGAKVMIVVG